jgi:flagellar protein FlaG
MGFSVTGSHVIFFIASIILAGSVSGVFMAATLNVTLSLSDRGTRIQELIDTDFSIINDNENIPVSGSYYLFYLKNVGGDKLVTTNQTFSLFIDGEILTVGNYNFSQLSILPGDITTIYISDSTISPGDHTLRVVGPQAIDDEFQFTI